MIAKTITLEHEEWGFLEDVLRWVEDTGWSGAKMPLNEKGQEHARRYRKAMRCLNALADAEVSR